MVRLLQPARTIPAGPNVFVLFVLTVLFAGCQMPPPGEIVPDERGVGNLRLHSSPAGARVTIDGQLTQLRTPTVVPPLPAGEHLVNISLSGHREWERSVLVKSGETVNLDVRLEPTATGVLRVSSVPFQCRILVDGRPTPWLTPATLEGLPVGTHTVMLQREGYEDWSQAVVILENRQLQVTASLKPAAGMTGHVRIQSHPPKADISLDGFPTGNTSPTTLYNLQPGSHLLVLSREGYHDWRGEVTVREDETENLLLALERSQPRLWGSAEISSIPENAEVILDTVQLRTETPVLLETITHGTHLLRLEKEGYWPWEGELNVRPGETTQLSINLRPQGSDVGYLRLMSMPSGGAILIDGEPTDRVTPALFTDLSAGNHLVAVHKKGFRPWSRSIFISSGEPAEIQARLIPELPQ